MIIDAHTHAFPDRIASRALETLAKGAGIPVPPGGGTVAALLASMDQAGIDQSWVASIATRPEQAAAILEWSKGIRSPRIVPLGSVHPDSATWREELGRLAQAGLVGLKLHPQYQGFAADESRLMPLYREIARLGLLVLFHAGHDMGFRDDDRAAPTRLARVHAAVPDLVMVAAHLGGWMQWDEVTDFLAGTDVYLDLSYMRGISPAQRDAILGRHDPARLLFGSDHPWIGQAEALAEVRGLGLGQEALGRILGGNAARLLER